MTVTEITLLISAVGSSFASFASFVGLAVSLRNSRKLDHTDGKVEKVVIKVEEVHKATNSIVDKLVVKAGEEGHARGVQAGIELASTVQP